MLDSLSKRLPIARTQLADWTKQLQSAGITDTSVLRGGVRALASARALGGSGGAETIVGYHPQDPGGHPVELRPKAGRRAARQLAKSGVNIKDVADSLGVSVIRFARSSRPGSRTLARSARPYSMR